jgi:hypothetical protein
LTHEIQQNGTCTISLYALCYTVILLVAHTILLAFCCDPLLLILCNCAALPNRSGACVFQRPYGQPTCIGLHIGTVYHADASAAVHFESVFSCEDDLDDRIELVAGPFHVAQGRTRSLTTSDSDLNSIESIATVLNEVQSKLNALALNSTQKGHLPLYATDKLLMSFLLQVEAAMLSKKSKRTRKKKVVEGVDEGKSR